MKDNGLQHHHQPLAQGAWDIPTLQWSSWSFRPHPRNHEDGERCHGATVHGRRSPSSHSLVVESTPGEMKGNFDLPERLAWVKEEAMGERERERDCDCSDQF